MIKRHLSKWLMLYFLCVLIFSCKKGENTEIISPIIDSNYTFEEAIKETKAPQDIIDSLELVVVQYYSFDQKLHEGQIIIHKDLATDVKEIFELIKQTEFPIRKVIPIVCYDWDDTASLIDDNSSCFNYRSMVGSKKLSRHSLGRAIDINPLENPYIKGEVVLPPGAVYDPKVIGTFVEESLLVKEFKKRGWEWGGNWNSLKDYQHFEK